MRTNKEIVERLFDMLYGIANIGYLSKEEKTELEALEFEWNVQNRDE